MNLSPDEIRDLARAVIHTKPDEMDCDEWLEHAPHYAELIALQGLIPESLQRAAQHLDICPECAEEFQACLTALAAKSHG